MSSESSGALTTKTGERDLSMDYLKGLGCLMMIVAHSPLYFPDSPGSWLFRQIVSPGFVIFFGISAQSALFQRQRYGLKPTVLTYLWLLFLGANMTPLMQHFGPFDHFFIIEMLTIIAIGSLFVLLINEYSNINRWGYLAITLVIILLKFGIDRWGQGIDWPLFLAVNAGTVEYLPDGAARIYPGFSLIPWLAVFPFIQFVRRSSVLSNLTFSFLCSATVVIMVLIGWVVDLQLDLFNKWEPTPAYFLIVGALNCLVFALFAPGEQVLPFKPTWLVTLGKRSFIFLYAHIFGIFFGSTTVFLLLNNASVLFKAIPATVFIRQYVVWGVAGLLSVWLTHAINLIPRSKIFNHTLSWVILLFFILLVPIIVPNFIVVWLIEYALGIVLVTNIPLLMGRLRSQSR